MAIVPAKPSTLENALKSVKPGDVIELDAGKYAGTFVTGVNGAPDAPITVRPMKGAEPDVVFTGAANSVASLIINRPYWTFEHLNVSPTAGPDNSKPTWIAVRSPAVGTRLILLNCDRSGDIAEAKAWNDYGVVIEADHVTISHSQLAGMTKPIHLKGRCVWPTIMYNHIGPSYQSGIVVGTSFGTLRSALIAYNTIELSFIEDGVQTMQDFSAANPETDVSNLGMIFYRNIIRNHGENALDFKGAGFLVADGNEIYGIAGSNDGNLAGWNARAAWAITRGAKTASRHVIIRNHRIYDSASGIRLPDPNWFIYHNEIANNNNTPADPDYAGYGIRQVGNAANTGVKNNLVYGHRGADLALTGADASNNRSNPGPGGPLTSTRESGEGRILPLHQAGYFSGWFGRIDLPPEVIVIGEQKAHVVSVDYAGSRVTLDRDLTWKNGAPVMFATDAPNVGPIPIEPQPEPPPIVVEPPAQEVLTVRGSPASVAMLRAVLITLGDLQIED